MRIKRLELINDEEKHRKYVNKAYDVLFNNTIAGRLICGLGVLQIVRDVIIKHAVDVRHNPEVNPSFQNRFVPIKTKAEVHPMCPIMKKLPQQKEMLQLVASEMETFALILYMEDILASRGQIQKNDRFQEIDAIFKVNKAVEKSLNDLRMIKVS